MNILKTTLYLFSCLLHTENLTYGNMAIIITYFLTSGD
jgi:hypothetical protein